MSMSFIIVIMVILYHQKPMWKFSRTGICTIWAI